MKDSILVEYPAELLYPSSQKQELFICTLHTLDMKYSYRVTVFEYPIFIIILIIQLNREVYFVKNNFG